jgi:hypothetical protein
MYIQGLVQNFTPTKARPEKEFMGSQANNGISANGNKAREVRDYIIAMT